MPTPYNFEGLIYGAKPDLDREKYITLTDFPVPVTLKKAVYIIRKPLHIPVGEYGLPQFSSQADLEEWFEANKTNKLMGILLSFCSHYATTEEAQEEARAKIIGMFGI